MNIIYDIDKIENGWFLSKFTYGTEKVIIPASHFTGIDSPKYFLRLLSILTLNQFDNGYVIFDGETETFFLCIKKIPKVEMEIFYSNLHYNEISGLLPVNASTGTNAFGNLSKEELKRKIPVGNVLFSAENFKWDTFATDVLGTFEIYLPRRKKNKYSGNWFEFPLTEIRELKYSLSL